MVEVFGYPKSKDPNEYLPVSAKQAPGELDLKVDNFSEDSCGTDLEQP